MVISRPNYNTNKKAKSILVNMGALEYVSDINRFKNDNEETLDTANFL